ncbi:MAG: MCE family protein [Ignavibacteriaceae bacterium]|nr:MCE family protein [Ignavibacteriaceae bacterium]
MKDQRKTEIKVGIISVLGTILFLWIFGWAKNFNLTQTENTVLVKFPNVSGLEVGDNVSVNGVRKGFVEDFNIQSKHVIVKLKVDNDIKLKEDAQFYVAMLDLMGGKKVEISPGASENNLDLNKIHEGKFETDIPGVLSVLGSVQGDLISSLKDFRITLSSLNNYLTDRQLENDLKNSLSNLSTLTQKINLLVDENRTALKSLISNANLLAEETKTFISNNSGNIESSLEKLNNVLVQTDSLLVSLNKITNETTSQQNNIGKILYDPNLLNDVKQSLNQVNELTRLLIEQLKDKGIEVNAHIF